MATYREMVLQHRLFMKVYPFSRYAINPIPCATLARPLNGARVALVTTAGFHTSEQAGFDSFLTDGDASFREISDTITTSSLIESHKSNSFDHSGVQADRNLAFPLDRFRELVARGEIGGLNHRHFSFMGSILRPKRLIAETAPQVAERLRADGVDVVLLTPV
ncbi:MAG: glycine/sarcosine/betaine reductase selenoprotein B family protein [Acidobacteriota bacterium]